MKYLILLFVSVSLTGCFYQSVTDWDIQRAIKHCGTLEDVVHINSHFQGGVAVQCRNQPKEAKFI